MQLHNSCHQVKTCNNRRLTCDHPTIRSVDSSGGLVAVAVVVAVVVELDAAVGVVDMEVAAAVAIAVVLVIVVVHSSPRHQT